MELSSLSAKQARSIARATARLNIWHGSVRSGKTLASLIVWAHEVARHDGHGDLLMVGKTERTLRRNIIGPLTDLLGTDAVSVKVGAGEATIFDSLVYLVGANDERAEQKIRGGTFARIYGDELTLWPESFFRMALTRMSPPGARLIGTTNPDSPLHWLKREFIDREAELDLRAFHFELADNPGLPADYLAALEVEFTGLWRKRFVQGLWVMAEGAIWDAFDTERHVVASVPAGLEFSRYFVGVDYGTANPFVALLVGIDVHGKLWVLDEWRHDSRRDGFQRTDAQYSAALGEWIKDRGVTPDAFYVDPSAASFILQLRHDHEWNVVEADNSVDDGLRHVSSVIAADNLLIVGCPDLCNEIVSYSWDPKAQEKGKDEPIKQADHGPDALRYGLYSHAVLDIGDLAQYGWVA